MAAVEFPDPLRRVLGDEPSRSLVHYIEDVVRQREEPTIARMEDRFEKRLAIEVGGLRYEMQRGFTELQKDFGIRLADVQRDFGTRFAGLERQLTIQTRWIIAVAAFIAVSFKVLDLFVG